MKPRHALVISPHGVVGDAVARELRLRGARVTGAGRTEPASGVVDAFHTVDLSAVAWPLLYEAAAAGGPLDSIVYAAGVGDLRTHEGDPPGRGPRRF